MNEYADAAMKRWVAADDLPVGACAVENADGTLSVSNDYGPHTYRAVRTIRAGQRVRVVRAGYAVMMRAIQPDA